MKKVFKSRLFAFIIGGLLFGTIGVIATNINASQIDYNDTTVDAALDDLYTLSNRSISLTSPVYSETLTTASATVRQQTIELTKGEWIVTYSRVSAWGRPTATESMGTSAYNIICGSGTVSKATSKSYQKAGTDPIGNTTAYATGRLYENIYLVKITADTDTCYIDYKDSSDNLSVAEMDVMQAVKINYQ